MWYKIDNNIVEGKFYLTCIKKMGGYTSTKDETCKEFVVYRTR